MNIDMSGNQTTDAKPNWDDQINRQTDQRLTMNDGDEVSTSNEVRQTNVMPAVRSPAAD